MTASTWNHARTYINASGGLAGRSKLGVLWGVSRERVAQLTRIAGFPEPVAHVSLRNGDDDQPVWLVDEATTWREEFYPNGGT